jgi:amino acid permease
MLVDGGTAGMFWSYTWVIVGQFFIVVSLAEMSSMAPTAGGQVLHIKSSYLQY